MQKLRAAVSEEDPKAVREAAHALKSSSANVGAKSLAELCKQLEAMGRQGNLSSASLLLDAFDAEYKDVVAALRKEVHDIAA